MVKPNRFAAAIFRNFREIAITALWDRTRGAGTTLMLGGGANVFRGSKVTPTQN